jgi:hypothetical protein
MSRLLQNSPKEKKGIGENVKIKEQESEKKILSSMSGSLPRAESYLRRLRGMTRMSGGDFQT